MRFNNKVAIVTGAASGIGRATAIRLAAEGAKIIVVDSNEAGAQKVVREIDPDDKGTAFFIAADISKEHHVVATVAAAMKNYGRVDILVNNAARFVLKGVDATFEDWHESLGTNVIGTALMTKHVVNEMKKTGGAIVMLGSISSFVAQPEFVTYSATKAALVQMTKNFAMDFAKFNIRVNCVCPGPTWTSASEKHARQAGITEEELRKELGDSTMLKRVAEPDEIASAILFLASKEASYITGAHLMVDGGYVAI